MLDGCRAAGNQPTVPVYEENGKVKHGVFGVSANINSINLDPPSLGTRQEL